MKLHPEFPLIMLLVFGAAVCLAMCGRGGLP